MFLCMPVRVCQINPLTISDSFTTYIYTKLFLFTNKALLGRSASKELSLNSATDFFATSPIHALISVCKCFASFSHRWRG